MVGVYAGYVDTDLAADIDSPKILATDVAEKTMAALLNDESEVLVDDTTRQIRAALSGDLETLYANR
ncbi:hypothetical protein [Streptomyces sp. MS1.AVA.4]|uniref:Uncharacterized protein n=1 Tax=Streptomyces pratisoli TaxID=3139917 RepID=A0ACC6QSQ5_9ACTN